MSCKSIKIIHERDSGHWARVINDGNEESGEITS